VNTNPYEAKPADDTEARSSRAVWGKVSRRVQLSMRFAALLIFLPLLFLLLVSIPAAAGSLDYTRKIPVSEAVEYAVRADWNRLWHDYRSGPRVLFAAMATVGLVAFMLCPFRFAPFISLVNAGLIALTGFHMLLGLSIAWWVILPMWFHKWDGETWSEGFVFGMAAFSWSYLWLVGLVAFTLLRFRACRRLAKER
jgi:hypothetical protein